MNDCVPPSVVGNSSPGKRALISESCGGGVGVGKILLERRTALVIVEVYFRSMVFLFLL